MTCCFPRLSVKFLGYTGQKKSPILTWIKRFRTVTPIWFHRGVWDLIAAAGLVILLKLDSNRRFLAHVTLKFDGWPRKIIGHLFYITSSFVNLHKAWCNVEEVPYNFSRSSIKFQGTRAKNRRFESNLSRITRPVAAIKSLRFALLYHLLVIFFKL